MSDNGTNVSQFCDIDITNGALKNGFNIKMHFSLKHREKMIKHQPNILLTQLCSEFDPMFFVRSDLSKHVRESHCKLWKCNICGTDFVIEVKYLKHRQTAHPAELEASVGKKGQENMFSSKRMFLQSRQRTISEREISLL